MHDRLKDSHLDWKSKVVHRGKRQAKEPIEELHRLEEATMIEKVPFREWAALTVHLPKADGKVCICGD